MACGEQSADHDVVQAQGNPFAVFGLARDGFGWAGGAAVFGRLRAAWRETGGTAGAGFVVAADRTPGIRYIVAAPCRNRAKLGRAAGSGATGAPITCIGPVRGGKGAVKDVACQPVLNRVVDAGAAR